VNIYTRNGHENRAAYLESLAEDFGTDSDTVHMLADLLGESEDFDGLLTMLDDYAEGF